MNNTLLIKKLELISDRLQKAVSGVKNVSDLLFGCSLDRPAGNLCKWGFDIDFQIGKVNELIHELKKEE